MKISCIQMDMQLAKPDENFAKAEKLIEKAMENSPDVLVLPETWNTGFFPKENLCDLADSNGEQVKKLMSRLAKKYSVNIVAGSVANRRNGKIYNTAYIFDRKGEVIGEYDKTHLFTPMSEDDYFTKGEKLCTFTLDGTKCGIIICYDIRFPELARSLTTQTEEHLDCLFVVSQWPEKRAMHLETLARARAIENQMFLACCNSCGVAGDTVYGGGSMIFDPWGEFLAKADKNEEIIFADLDLSVTEGIRKSINVFADRRQELYKIK